MDSVAAAGATTPPTSGYRFRGDLAVADVAFEAWGASLGELFSSAADATTNAMSENLDNIEDRQRRQIRIEERSADLLLYRLLEELIFFKDTEGLLLRIRDVRIVRGDGILVLEAEARGEPLDPPRHHPRTDVKAVTLHRLRVERTAHGWEATVVLDV